MTAEYWSSVKRTDTQICKSNCELVRRSENITLVRDERGRQYPSSSITTWSWAPVGFTQASSLRVNRNTFVYSRGPEGSATECKTHIRWLRHCQKWTKKSNMLSYNKGEDICYGLICSNMPLWPVVSAPEMQELANNIDNVSEAWHLHYRFPILRAR
jgi:hypothetical protein